MRPGSNLSILLVLLLSSSACLRAAEPLYANSIVSTDLDFILDSDPNVLESVQFIDFSSQEMPDSRTDALFADAYRFECRYSDRTIVQILAHENLGSRPAAEVYVNLLANAIGQQPRFNRVNLHHVILHKGSETAFAEEKGRFFVIYSDNMDTRISNHDLQETVFHESAHIALEVDHATSAGWIQAQQADPGFITAYAKKKPRKEDISESALFAFVLLNHPGRLAAEIEQAVQNQIPHRIEYLRQINGFVVNEP